MISLWFFNKAKKRWVVSSRGSAGNSKLPSTWSSYMRLWDPKKKVILLQIFGRAPAAGDPGNHFLKMHLQVTTHFSESAYAEPCSER